MPSEFFAIVFIHAQLELTILYALSTHTYTNMYYMHITHEM